MTFVPYANRVSRPWRRFLTSRERSELAQIEREIGEIYARRRELTRQRALIQNRAAARAEKAKVPA